MEDLATVARRFCSGESVAVVVPFGSGNVNDTFLVSVGSCLEKRFILQRINTQVFRKPELLMQNLRVLTDHVTERLCRLSDGKLRRWETPRILSTRNGEDYWMDSCGSFWRAISFIESSESFDTILGMKHAGEIGCALGIFHNLVSDLPVERMADTLKGFHVTPIYLSHYDQVSSGAPVANTPEIDYAAKFISRRRKWASVLEDAAAKNELSFRTIHGDPKVNNILFDTTTGLAVAMIDLDTVKPGLVHYDIGDCLRSGCNLLGEETESWEEVRFDPDICRAVLQGYISHARAFLTEKDYEYFFDAIRLIPFELGLRFFTDYLEGSVYFKAKHEEHNLLRALVQFKLVESIESLEKVIRGVIKDVR